MLNISGNISKYIFFESKKFLSSTSKNVQVWYPGNVQLQMCTTMCHVVVLQRAMCVGTLGSTKQKPIYEKKNLD